MYSRLIGGLWLLWCLYWFISARGTKSTARRESLASRVTHLTPLVIGLMLIAFARLPGNLWSGHVLPPSLALYWVGVGLTAAGLGFTVWARVHLGANWSGTVTLKESHELIRSGPYAWVRHPIYTGLLTATLGSAIARDEWRAVIGFALVVASLVWKLKLEERWMREIFGDQYVKYAREVRALVPGVY
jgi:protein-S-isoprenylcysteine O-methyltransferase Ste14